MTEYSLRAPAPLLIRNGVPHECVEWRYVHTNHPHSGYKVELFRENISDSMQIQKINLRSDYDNGEIQRFPHVRINERVTGTSV